MQNPVHRDIKEEEIGRVFTDFAYKHEGHLASTDVTAGSWAIVLHCPLCKTWETYAVDNEARREALKCRGSEAKMKAVS